MLLKGQKPFIKSMIALLLVLLASGAISAQTDAGFIIQRLSSEDPFARKEGIAALPSGLEARSSQERRELLFRLVKALDDSDRSVADAAGQTLKIVLGQALTASEGLREPSSYLSDVVDSVALGLEDFGGRSRASSALMDNIDTLADNSGRISYLRLNLLLKALARQNVSLGADSALEEVLKKVGDIYGDAINSSNSRERERGMEGIRAALSAFFLQQDDGNLWNRKRAEGFLEDVMKTLESALRSSDSRVRLDAAKLARELLDRAQKMKLSRASERLKKEVVKALEDMLGDDSPEVRAESAEKLGKMGDVSSVPALEKVLSDRVSKVSEASAEAIRQLTGKKPELPKKGR